MSNKMGRGTDEGKRVFRQFERGERQTSDFKLGMGPTEEKIKSPMPQSGRGGRGKKARDKKNAQELSGSKDAGS